MSNDVAESIQKLFYMQLTKAYMAKMSCNQMID